MLAEPRRVGGALLIRSGIEDYAASKSNLG
jgi:hypothetical protein